jgi:pyruvate/2-oxoglutarate/acetoin dehydrogenase E1 component
MLYLESLNVALHDLMATDSDVVLIGEDLLDPYGGAFKVSKGLSTRFPNQVISTPISEQSIIGAAIGMAMRGMKPIVEIMFGDFLTLCMDQIVNHATKYNWMFNEQVNVPIVVRTPMGGGRGYGPTHSQSLESMFMSVPGLTIVAPSIFHDPGKLLKQCVMEQTDPCLFIENKLAYPKTLIRGTEFDKMHISRFGGEGDFENVLLSLYPHEQPDVLIVTYGGMADLAATSAQEIFIDEEVLVDVLLLGVVKPISMDIVIEQVTRASCTLVLEEGCQTGGWGAEVSSLIHEQAFPSINTPVMRLGAEASPIPSAISMEKEVLPSKSRIKKSIIKLIGRN